ncbi:MAG: hypothetical protein C0467_11995 [Planctomycetaceae bacterium]|nr:hypothetical protein [Planctomycetaceae bacterium]
MTRQKRLTAFGISLACVAAGIALVVTSYTAAQPPRPDLWKQVAEADAKGLPLTGIKALEPIIEGAIKDKAYPEAIKAIAKKINLEGNIEGNKPEEKITRMQAEIEGRPAEMKPVMTAILAHWYWQYFQQNRWRFTQRTQTGNSPGEDIQTWDLPRIFAEIDKTFEKAIANEKELKATPIAQFAILLEKGSIPDKYRPTLYDFLAFDALSFYSSAEQAGAKPQDSFNLTADSPIFDSLEKFLAWEPKTTDANNRTVKGIKLFQKLLAFHKDDNDNSALLDTDLHRLRFGHNKAVGTNKNDRYKAALEAFSKANAKHELFAMAQFQLASVIQGEGDLVKAREVALVGMNAFPDSPGGKLCFNLVQSIESKSASVTTERVWAEPLPDLRVSYKNITKVYFRVVKADYIDRLKQAKWRPEHLNENEAKALLSLDPVLSFEHDLPATPDYKLRTESIPAPKGLKPGFYYIIAGHTENFAGDAPVTYTDFFACDLALIDRNDYSSLVASGQVTTATTGEPVEGAKAQVWLRQNNGGWAPGESGITDKNGLYRITVPRDRAHMVVVTHKDMILATAHDSYSHGERGKPHSYESVVFFTDRSLYRPGQTISFKGIVTRTDEGKDNYETVANRKITVQFKDVNGKEIAKLDTTSNDFGSISGSFTAPRDRLMGHMHIYAVETGSAAAFNVEEYKRPKFKVEVEAPKEAFKLNDTVKVPGKAMQYNGVPVGAAKVAFRVTREVRYPDWFFEYCWWRPVPNRPAQEIANGVVQTELDGSFTIPFVALPDLTVNPKDEPAFRYSITADVTDTTGETRTGTKAVQVGYVALRAKLSTDAWLTTDKDVKFDINTATLDGEGQVAKGTIKVYALKQPEKPARGEIDSGRYWWRPVKEDEVPKPDPAKPISWELGDVAFSGDFTTNGNGKADTSTKLAPGIYRAILETADKFGKKVTTKYQFTVLNPAAATFNVKIPNFVAAPKWSVEPGEEFTMLWGTGYESGRAFVEVEHRGKNLQAYWTEPGKTQFTLKQAVTEDMRGGFTVRITYVRENRAYLTSRHIDVPWSNKNLTVKWERFISKLEPGQKETYTAIVTGPNAAKAVAEMVAGMYDASLDAYLPHNWMERFSMFRHDRTWIGLRFENTSKYFNHIQGQWPHSHKNVDLTYRGFPAELTQNYMRYEYFSKGGGLAFDDQWGFGRGEGGGLRDGMYATAGGGMAGMAPPRAPGANANGLEQSAKASADAKSDKQNGDPGGPNGGDGPDLNSVSARKNLNETAFFFPHLVSNAEGEVRIEFQVPEALTKWKLMAFAHDKNLRSGFIKGEVVTAKDLMAQPNPPRFLREGDILEFTTKVSNQGATRQKGAVKLALNDTRTMKPLDAELANTVPTQEFDLPAGESKTFSWRINVPDGVGPLTYKVVAASERHSDGEEGIIPVLSRRVLVQESMPLPIRNAGSKNFDFAKLRLSGESNTIKHQSYTVQMVSQPAWYAVMALPYLMEFPHECTEQTFNRLYANSLAHHIGKSDPKIRRVFDQWKGTDALDSPLEKNQDLKSVMLEETPWVRQAVKEGQARKNVGILFDENRLNNETANLMAKLAQMQYADGAWPWFPGGPGNDYITLYITTGYGRLRHLGVKIDAAPAVRAIDRLDNWADQQYQWALKHKPDDNHLSPTIALYLYARSFFLADKAVANQHKNAIDYWLGQAKKYWLKLANRQSQAHLAVGLKRFGDKETPTGIMRSIKERSKTDEEMGMYWRDLELNFSWFHAPIETQAMMIEAFDEVMNDATSVEDCKVWLLKMKQTTDWKTTKATADAIYALLLRGDNLLKSDAIVEVSVGNQAIKPEKVEAGTGFYEHKFLRTEVLPSLATITVKKTDPGVSWGSVHWSYLEDISKVTPHEGTPLKLEKKLFKRAYTKAGPVITEVKPNDAIAVGDEIVVRIVLRTDRDMEYVHMKDHRGSGTEPVNVLSRYKYQDGLGYYESTKDTASHFYIDYLPKGTYVFEYPVRVQHKGKYPTGYANIQCMYAPEFNSHSENINLEVK